MVMIKVYDKKDRLIMDIDAKPEQRYNPRLKRKKSILAILLDNQIEMYYGCMGGSCSACITELISGEEFIDKEGLHEQVYKGIKGKDFLSCIATIKDNIDEENSVVVLRTKL
jgi:ferredoxin